MPDYSWGCDRCNTKNPAYTEVCRDCGFEYTKTVLGSKAKELREKSEFIAAQRAAISPPPDSQPIELAGQRQNSEHSDKRLLEYFFWFSLVLSLFLALVAPSGATIGIVVSVIGLGIPLFITHDKGRSASPSNNSAYGVHISKPWWLFLVFSTLVMPFVLGWRLGKDLVIFFVLAFFGLAMATIVLVVTKLSSNSER